MTTLMNDYFGETIFSYTREQAVTDGVLVDITEYAKEFGFKYPVSVTRLVWETCISWDNDKEQVYQDEIGRLCDILWMAYLAARRSKGTLAIFDIERIANGQREPSTVTLKSVCGPGDAAEPVITIMRTWED